MFWSYFFFTPPRNCGGVTFSLLSVCLSVCLCVWLCLWTKFEPIGWTDLDVVFAKWLLTALAWSLLKLGTLGQRSRSQWRNTHFFFIILCFPYFVSQLSYVRSKWNSVCRLDIPLVDLCSNFIRIERWWSHYDVILVFSKQFSTSQIVLNVHTSYLKQIQNNITSI